MGGKIKKTVGALSLLASFGCSSIFQNVHAVDRGLSSTPSVSVLPKACYDPNATAELTFHDIRRALSANQIESPEAMLDFFAKNRRFQGLVKDPILLKNSGALHGDEVSPAFPRIGANTGNLSMHLVGLPRGKGICSWNLRNLYLPEVLHFTMSLTSIIRATKSSLKIHFLVTR